MPIFSCPTCKPNTFQDERYGNRMRVQNECFGANKRGQARCTVCLTLNSIK